MVDGPNKVGNNGGAQADSTKLTPEQKLQFEQIRINNEIAILQKGIKEFGSLGSTQRVDNSKVTIFNDPKIAEMKLLKAEEAKIEERLKKSEQIKAENPKYTAE